MGYAQNLRRVQRRVSVRYPGRMGVRAEASRVLVVLRGEVFVMICPSGKRCYRGRAEAIKANRTNSKRLRTYRCDLCGFYHVTQQSYGKDTHE